jgi:purine-binding chemotaxis protein CheW
MAKTIKTENADPLLSFFTFRMMDETFAIDVLKVIEILELSKITKVPRSPDFMVGIINLRGNVLPVIDARTKFGMPKKEATVDTCIIVMDIVVDDDTVTLGALVDSVSEVMEVKESAIQKSPTIGVRYNSDFIDGLVKKDDDFIMILNIGKAFSQEEVGLLNLVTESKHDQLESI